MIDDFNHWQPAEVADGQMVRWLMMKNVLSVTKQNESWCFMDIDTWSLYVASYLCL